MACSSLLGDFDVTSGTRDAGQAAVDAGANDVGPDAGIDAPPATVRALAVGSSVYVGQAAKVDATGSTATRGALSFAWSMQDKPSGSAVDTADIKGAGAAVASFLPDVPGNYTLLVKVTAAGGTDTHTATVTAASPMVLFAQGYAGGGHGDAGATLYYSISDLQGGNAHPVLCPDVISSASAGVAGFAAFAGRAYDYWEAPAGQPSRYAAFTVEAADGGGWNGHLWVGTSASTCAPPSQPGDLGTSRFGPGRPYGSEPRFKPDGSRFAVFDDKWRIVTYAGDALTAEMAGGRVVASYSIPPSLGATYLDPVGIAAGSGYVVEPPRVAWTATGLAWAQPTQDGWEIVTAPDMLGATLTTYMVCSGVTPREIAMLDDGTVLASYRDSPQTSENLFLLKPDAQRNCVHDQQYTHLSGGPSSIATDFAVSPDGTLIAFVQLDATTQDTSPWMAGGGQLPGGYVYVVPVAGGPPVRVSDDPAIYGPRWVAGGTGLVFTRLDGVAPASGKEAMSVVYVAPDGGSKHTIVQGDGVTSFVSTSGNAACAASGGTGSGSTRGALFALTPLVAAFARRARRKRPGS